MNTKKLLASLVSAAMLISAVTVGSYAAKYTEDPNHFTDDTPDLNQADAGIDASSAQDPIATKEVAVNVKTNQPGSTTHVYAVSYSHTELIFTYNMGGSKVWNPDELRYENIGGSGDWASATQDLTVTNYSDLAVKVTASVSQAGLPEEGVVTVTATQKGEVGSEITLGSAYNSGGPDSSAATSGTFEIKVDGKPRYEYTTATKIAAVTLTLAKST